jgi:CRISPR-associated exonuclease Cas4
VDTITGTLVWYYVACRRRCWLMAHEISPDEDDTLLDLGRLLHEETYKREEQNKGFDAPGMKLDLVRKDEDGITVCEVKKSDRFIRPAAMQLCFYLWRLKQQGIIARGELLIPARKKRIRIELSERRESELVRIMSEIERLVAEMTPPAVTGGKYCKKCAYREFCFA